MCGIFGYAGFTEPELLARMGTALSHRGPDRDATWTSPTVPLHLGNRRLTIIDPRPSADMPMANEDGTVWLTYNGEVYNASDLRAQLGHHRFRSRSDSEVLLHAYEEWGPDFLFRLRGMFALAIWDEHSRRLLLARDQFGQKPLYYWRNGAQLAFASEIRALLCSSRISAAIDCAALSDYVRYGYVLGERTGFAGIATLPPAHAAEWTESGWRTWRFWSLPPPHEIAEDSDAAWRARISEQVRESVRLRLIGDVPIGVMLSGGLDSSLVLSLANRASTRDLRTFTAEFPDSPELSEAEKVDRVRRHIGKHYERVVVPRPSAELLLQLAAVLEEPLADPSSLPTWQIARRARSNGIVILLSGEGADELFWGYPRYRALQFSETHPWLRNAATRALLRASGRRGLLEYFAPAPLAARNYQAIGLAPLSALAALYPGLADVSAPMQLPYGSSPADAAARWDIENWLPRDILTRVDKTLMAASVEGRPPLLDPYLAEAALRLPARLKIRPWEDKRILREIAAPFLPVETRHAPKQAFQPPVAQWLASSAGETLQQLVEESELVRSGLIAHEGARALAHNCRRVPGLARPAWALLSLLTWHVAMIARPATRAAVP